MADHKVIGKDYPLKDLLPKITGQAKYAEDFRAEGMAFAKLLLSPLPRARVRRIDARAALSIPGVLAILTADDVDILVKEGTRQGVSDLSGEPILTNDPHYQGQPIAAIAAVDETTAAEAIDALVVDYEPLPFALDPLESLRPGGPNARDDGNVYTVAGATDDPSDSGPGVRELKWTEADVAAIERGEWPVDAETVEGWQYGDVEAGFAAATLILQEPIYCASQSHHCLEPRTAMAYWQNGKLYLHTSTQSVAQMRRHHAVSLGLDEEDVILVGNFCGGGFGSKNSNVPTDMIPSLMSQKLGGRPVMLRVTRDEETYFGRARPGHQGFVKIGFRPDGRITALDLFLVTDSGPIGPRGDGNSVANYGSLAHQPENMRFRAVNVATNTPPRGAQRAPGGMQMVTMLEPLMGRAARELGIDRLELMRINAPSGRAPYGERRAQVTSAFVPEAIEIGRRQFRWDEKRQLSGRVDGSKVTGIGAAISPYPAGSIGFDGLLLIRPDGRVEIHQGIGNLGSHSVFDTAMAAAEVLGQPWDLVDIVWGDTSTGLPWSARQGGSQTTHAHTRANHAAGMDARQKLQEIAAGDLGGAPADYEVSDGRVFRRDDPGVGMSLGRAAERAIQLGGRFDGHELNDDLDPMTVASAGQLVGKGLVGAAKDNYGRQGGTYSFVVGFCRVEVDRETGIVEVKEYLAVADCGTVLHPRSLAAQLHGGALQGMSIAHSERWAIDPQWGVHLNPRLYTAKPMTILDVPLQMDWAAVNLPDPQTPVGSKGIGEPPVGAGNGAFLDAVADALGGRLPVRRPLTPDNILNFIAGLESGCHPLQAHV